MQLISQNKQAILIPQLWWEEVGDGIYDGVTLVTFGAIKGAADYFLRIFLLDIEL